MRSLTLPNETEHTKLTEEFIFRTEVLLRFMRTLGEEIWWQGSLIS
jgi:hypothetical protein